MKKIIVLVASAAMLATAASALAAGPAGAQGVYVVTSSDGDGTGPGTIRDALASGQGVISVDDSVGTIAISSALSYTGTRSLRIYGNGATIDGGGGGYPLFESTMGADIVIDDLDFDNGGGFGLGDQRGEPGIHIVVPGSAAGTVEVTLTRVDVTGVAGHGVWVDDNAGSAAGVDVRARLVNVDGAGFGDFDRDGIRVDETGPGDIEFTSWFSSFTGNGADGVELDERGGGSVLFTVYGSHFDDNGDYCDGVDPGSPSGGEEQECVEDGELDLDDGFDIDEADTGSIVGTATASTADGNFDEGFDFDEAGTGDLDVVFNRVTANGNVDEGLKGSEEDGGSILVTIRHSTVSASGDNDGVEFEELGEGDLEADVRRLVSTNHDSSGLKLVEEDGGSLAADIRLTTLAGNGEDGLELEEADAGTLTADVALANLAGNADYGLQAEEDDGSGILSLLAVSLTGNGIAATDLDGVALV